MTTETKTEPDEKTETQKQTEQTTDQKQKEVEQKEQQEPQISQQVLDANSEFDKKVEEEPNGEETDTADEKAEIEAKAKAEQDAKAAEAKEKAEKEAEEKAGEKGTQEDDKVFDTNLLERAAKAGLTLAQAKSFSDPKDLEAALGIFEAAQSTEPGDTADKKDAAGDKETGGEKPFDCGLSKDEYDDALVDSINKMGNSLVSRINKLEADKLAFQKDSEERSIGEHTSWLDDQFNGLGEEFKDVLGKGKFGDISKDSKQFKNRAAVDSEMAAIVAGYQKTGKALPSKKKVFERAINNTFGDEVKRAANAETAAKLKQRASQTVGRGSRGSASAGTDKALQAQKDFDAKIDK